MVIGLLPLGAVVLLTVVVSRLAPASVRHPHGDAAPHRQRAAEALDRLPVELVFCTEEAGLAHLDCVVADGAAAGWPFELTVLIPHPGSWADDGDVLTHWTSGEVVVDLSVVPLRGRPWVTITDGTTSLHFEAARPGESLAR
jgi:hypothetical protein